MTEIFFCDTVLVPDFHVTPLLYFLQMYKVSFYFHLITIFLLHRITKIDGGVSRNLVNRLEIQHAKRLDEVVSVGF